MTTNYKREEAATRYSFDIKGRIAYAQPHSWQDAPKGMVACAYQWHHSGSNGTSTVYLELPEHLPRWLAQFGNDPTGWSYSIGGAS